jgi:hypothetical protein
MMAISTMVPATLMRSGLRRLACVVAFVDIVSSSTTNYFLREIAIDTKPNTPNAMAPDVA